MGTRPVRKASTHHVHAVSLDMPAAPAVRLSVADSLNWGIAWFPNDDAAAAVVKDVVDIASETADLAWQRSTRYRSTSYFVSTTSTSKQLSQQDVQPFVRSFGRRDVACLVSESIKLEERQNLPELAPNSTIEPVGRTTGEYVFCWLLNQIIASGGRTICQPGWPQLQTWLKQLNEAGPVSVVVSDGIDLLAYCDLQAEAPLFQRRLAPPHEDSAFKLPHDLHLDLSDPRDFNRTLWAVTTHPWQEEGWEQMSPGQFLIVRRGKVIWNSEGQSTQTSTLVKPLEGSTAQGAPLISETADLPLRPVLAAQAFTLASAQTSNNTGLVRRLLRISHETSYEYATQVDHSIHMFRLKPIQDHSQQLLEYRLSLEPTGRQNDYEDVFGNSALRVVVDSPYTEFRIRMDALVQILDDSNLVLPHEKATIPLVWMPWQRQMMHAYLLPQELPETQLQELSDYAMSFVERQDYDLVEALRDINRTINSDFRYLPGSTTVETTPYDVFASREGVCQDFANLFICLARLLGVPARYRVGYIYTAADYVNTAQSDASHAWAEVYLPMAGWRGFDPTNACEANLDHIRVAAGRNYRDATPTSGTIFRGGGTETLTVAVKVTDETPTPDPADNGLPSHPDT